VRFVSLFINQKKKKICLVQFKHCPHPPRTGVEINEGDEGIHSFSGFFFLLFFYLFLSELASLRIRPAFVQLRAMWPGS
jgi:hypothetical protein